MGNPSTNALAEPFNSLSLKPGGYWHRIHSGGSVAGGPERIYGDEYGTDSRVRVSGGSLELTCFPQDDPHGHYVNAELAERNTGLAHLEEGEYRPVLGKPVKLQARMKWGPGHNADGSGGAEGSSGVWLWNSPGDLTNPGYYTEPFEAFGFSWSPSDSAAHPGLCFALYRTTPYGPAPVYTLPVGRSQGFNIRQYHAYEAVWGVSPAAGGQEVRVLVDGVQAGRVVLAPQDFGALSLELWSDNQVPTPQGVEYRNPPNPQTLHVDRVDVRRA